MSAAKEIIRYYLIAETIKNKKFPKLTEIHDLLADHDIDISERSLQRNIEQLRTDFDMPIEYSHSQQGYFMDTANQTSNDNYYRFLEMAYTGQFLLDRFNKIPELKNHFHFEKSEHIGSNHLPKILEAIKTKHKLSFSHYNYSSDTNKEHLVRPYLIKEYQNRWYLVGYAELYKEVRSFGLDRIESLEILSDKFKENDASKLKDKFESIIGLNYSNTKEEKLVLSFTPMQAKYIKSQPWHHSQELVYENETEVLISLYLRPNFELEQRILMYGSEVKVVSPDWLKAKIKVRLEEALGRY